VGAGATLDDVVTGEGVDIAAASAHRSCRIPEPE